MFPYAFANLLDSTSIVGFNYYLQLVGKNKTMRFYDYGPTENMKRYGRPTPEDVDLTKTTVKCNFFALGSDSVTVPEVCSWLNTWRSVVSLCFSM
ncbi:Gastric triacylglycerol lipase [Frankliniella fusca]|uniref:Gastric triacylglycerol lipase n=1 Tax=Frankliniella fusca TaxID=407009 RepID=A0AAE1GWS4_9NEOP|nr:Gastric triacylglycerol lipase [Frankliniella fusca]